MEPSVPPTILTKLQPVLYMWMCVYTHVSVYACMHTGLTWNNFTLLILSNPYSILHFQIEKKTYLCDYYTMSFFLIEIIFFLYNFFINHY